MRTYADIPVNFFDDSFRVRMLAGKSEVEKYCSDQWSKGTEKRD